MNYNNVPQLTAAQWERLRLPQRWICDSCREIIQCPEDAWIEFLNRVQRDHTCLSMYPRIVHHAARCQYQKHQIGGAVIGDHSLVDMQNEDGIQFLVFRKGIDNRPEKAFIPIAWRLVVWDYDFGQRKLVYNE